jgi:hypothetical protein
MDAKELRIGNWVETYTGLLIGNAFSTPRIGYRQVNLQDLEIISKLGHTYRGISLTSELLDKTSHFKRTKTQNQDFFFNGDNILVRVSDMGLYLHSEVDGSTFWVRHLHHVHELQNAYFMIEGIELEINL